MLDFSWAEVCTRRLRRHYLSVPAPAADLVQVVRAVGGVQAQIGSAAEWAIGVRTAGVTQADVRAALWDTRRLVKTYGPRGTLHLLPADELPLWMAALRAREARYGSAWQDRTNLDPAPEAALSAAIADALDGQCLTREALTEAVVARVGEGARERVASNWGEPLGPVILSAAKSLP